MLADARWLPDGSELETDLCVIGAGPAGITLALELADAGFRTMVLEAGAERPERKVQAGARGENHHDGYYRLDRTRIWAFGGASNHWMESSGMRARPLDPLDFEARPEVGRDGWPFGSEELDRHYKRAQEICGLGPSEYAVERWAGEDLPALALDPAHAETVMFQVGPLDQFSQRLPDLAALDDVQLLLRATVLRLELDDLGGRIERVEVATGKGRRAHVRAKMFVLASGGIENARTLLLSNDRRPAGLGNARDLVGRHFMEHPHVRTGMLVSGDPELTSRIGLYGRRWTDGTQHLGMLKIPDEVLREEGLLGCVWGLWQSSTELMSGAGRALVGLREELSQLRRLPHTGERLATVLREPAATARALGTARLRRYGGTFGHPLVQLVAMSEQEPNLSSRITLGKRRDGFGRRVARTQWRLTDLDKHSIRRTQELLAAAFEQSGLGHVEQLFGDERPPSTIGGGHHQIGTTRMHASPRKGVTDADGRVHDVANLYVAGMSVFPTAGYANPTLTVVALAARLADHLRHELGG